MTTCRDLSSEAVHLYIQALQGILAQPSLSRKAKLDIGVFTNGNKMIILSVPEDQEADEAA